MTDAGKDILCTWDGEAFTPAGAAWAKRADASFVIGERYMLEAHTARSSASHRHFFAAVNEAFQNLPEHLAERFPTADHLRKYALIRAGFRDEHSIACASKAEAVRVAALIRPIDDFAVITVTECVVTAYTAKSQSGKAMGHKEFQRSKDMVLDVIAKMIGTDAAALSSNTPSQEPDVAA